MEQKNNIIKVAITGPESSGKSYTAEFLARYYDGWLVPEYAREYLNAINRPYNFTDLLMIARGQQDMEEKIIQEAVREEVNIVFFDTEHINIKIWAEEKFGQADPLITEYIQKATYDHYLLMKPDIAWEPDPLRENPHDRDRLFALFEKHLSEFHKPYTIIEGALHSRLELARNVVRTLWT